MTNMTKNIDFLKEFPLDFPQIRMKVFELGAEFTSVDERIFPPSVQSLPNASGQAQGCKGEACYPQQLEADISAFNPISHDRFYLHHVTAITSVLKPYVTLGM